MHKLSTLLIAQLRRMAMALLLAIAAIGNLQGAVLTDLRIVTYTGQSASDASAGATFDGMGFPHLDNFGRASFSADINDPSPGGLGDRTFWSEEASGLRLVVRGGQPAPGFPANQPFTSFLDVEPVVSRSGHAAFTGRTLSPPPPTPPQQQSPLYNTGVWTNRDGGTLALVARAGQQAPGTPDGQLFHRMTESPAVNSLGDVAFLAELAGPGVISSNNHGIWLWRNGDLQLAARGGQSTPQGVVGVIQVPLALNSTGKLAFYSTTGVWQVDPVLGLSRVVGHGESAFGFPAGATVRVTRPPQINTAGNLLYRGIARLSSGEELYALWGDTAGIRRLVASEGQQAPGAPLGVAFHDVFESNPAIDAVGRATFHANLTGPGVNASNSEGIWTESFGNGLQLVARTGDQAPGLASGLVFNELRISFQGLSRNVNGPGQIAFLAELAGPGVNGGNNQGMWATDLNGMLRLIAREGDQIDLSNGLGTDVRTIQSLNFQYGKGNDSGGRSSFNDLGQIAFGATFTDGASGIFVTYSVAVPEPAALALAAIAIFALVTARSSTRRPQ